MEDLGMINDILFVNAQRYCKEEEYKAFMREHAGQEITTEMVQTFLSPYVQLVLPRLTTAAIARVQTALDEFIPSAMFMVRDEHYRKLHYAGDYNLFNPLTADAILTVFVNFAGIQEDEKPVHCAWELRQPIPSKTM